ncbi:MAG: GNAT family N-acetyltransferase [Planctomycetota bacterium]|jgi:GNAT superfamily N-acetyltransferase
MMDFSQIKLSTADESDCEFAYEVKKKAEGEYIAEIWGWDETFQRDYHDREWGESKPCIIKFKGRPIGTIFIKKNENYFEIGRFFILPEFQRKGIGSYILKRILQEADELRRVTKLAHLNNSPVRSLYERHGFDLRDQNETHCFMERKPIKDS